MIRDPFPSAPALPPTHPSAASGKKQFWRLPVLVGPGLGAGFYCLPANGIPATIFPVLSSLVTAGSRGGGWAPGG